MTFSWISDFVPTSLFAKKFRTLAFGPLGTLPSTPRRIGICVPPHDIQHHCHKLIGSSMSESGQNRKSSMRAHVFRFTPESRHCPIESACPFRAPGADITDRAIGRFAERQRPAL